jgi:hypothetical protein
MGAPRCGDLVERSLQRHIGGEAANAIGVAGERHGAMEKLGDVKAMPDGGRRRLSAVVLSVAYSTEANRSGGSHSRSMAAG